MTIYVLTFKSTAGHDAEKRAGLNRFLKTMLRTYKLRCVGIEEREEDAKPRRATKAMRSEASALAERGL